MVFTVIVLMNGHGIEIVQEMPWSKWVTLILQVDLWLNNWIQFQPREGRELCLRCQYLYPRDSVQGSCFALDSPPGDSKLYVK